MHLVGKFRNDKFHPIPFRAHTLGYTREGTNRRVLQLAAQYFDSTRLDKSSAAPKSTWRQRQLASAAVAVVFVTAESDRNPLWSVS